MDGTSFFAATSFVPPDAIFELTARYLKDPYAQKVNLGQGTYRDGDGQPWVLPSVAASRDALREEGLLHEYLPILGLSAFRHAAARLVLGREIFDAFQARVSVGLDLEMSFWLMRLGRDMSKHFWDGCASSGWPVPATLLPGTASSLHFGSELVESRSGFLVAWV